MADVFSTRFEQLLHGKIKKAAADEANNVTAGLAKDFPDYRYRTGKIEGLNDALRLFEEVRQELFGNSSNGKDAKTK